MAAVKPKESVKRARAEMYRRLILEAAEEEFAASGFEEAKMQDIAKGSGIALGTLYGVFPGKAEIYEAIQELRGREILDHVLRAIQGEGAFEVAASKGIEAYVRCLVDRPNYLRMHLREGLSWADQGALRSRLQVDTWERGMKLAVGLMKKGIEVGYLHGEEEPELQMKMLIAAHQVQLRDWLDRGGRAQDVDRLIERMQAHFRRSLLADSHTQVTSFKTSRRARK
jgi:AcrR family transcriptional regulator